MFLENDAHFKVTRFRIFTAKVSEDDSNVHMNALLHRYIRIFRKKYGILSQKKVLLLYLINNYKLTITQLISRLIFSYLQYLYCCEINCVSMKINISHKIYRWISVIRENLILIIYMRLCLGIKRWAHKTKDSENNNLKLHIIVIAFEFLQI